MYILLWIWQLPQHVLGLLLIIVSRAKKVNGYYTVRKLFNSAVSLGDYIIFQADCIATDSVQHEKGHQVQSRMYGWLYLLIVGLPSIARNIWDRLVHKNWTTTQRAAWYYSGFPENQADKLGGVAR